MKSKLLIFLIIIFLSPTQSNAAGTKNISFNHQDDVLKIIQPEKIESATCINIYKNLRARHYNNISINDALSEKIFKNYIKALDESKVYFTEKDIKNFEQYKYIFDDAVKTGNLNFAFKMFNIYYKRSIERLDYMIANIQCCYTSLNLEDKSYFETDPEKTIRAKNYDDLKKKWNIRLRNEIINELLSAKKKENVPEVLIKRYKNQRNRITQINSEDVFRIFANSFAETYDPHTKYFSPRVSEDFNIRMSLSLEGIGAILQSDNEYTKIVRLVTAGPAEKSKQLKPGDRIIGVGQGAEGEIIDVIGWRLDDVVQLIRGPKNTIVRLKILPASAHDSQTTRIISITRNTVKLEEQAASSKIDTIKNNGKEYKIGVITIPTFYIDFSALQKGDPNYKSTTRDVRKLINKLKKENIDGLIIDLRENGGGALQEASALTGLFIKTGPTVIVRESSNRISAYTDNDPEIAYKGPLLVLVNRMSASASEIFAGAIQDYRRGIIAGTRTFGKGTVQSLLSLNQGQLKITIAKFYRVSGKSTQNLGVIPDIKFPSLYNFDELGESSLPEAMPWDKIDAENYKYYNNADFNKILKELDEKHIERTKNSIEFEYLREYSRHLNKLRDNTEISLSKKVREAKQKENHAWRLKLENQLRHYRNKPLFKSYEEFINNSEKEEKDIEENKKDNAEFDALLNESENIISDYITIRQN